MDHRSLSGTTVSPILSTGLPAAEYALMPERKGNSQNKSFINKVDPAFDPVTAALRQMHDDFASEPIPDDFMRLLDEIDARISKGQKPS